MQVGRIESPYVGISPVERVSTSHSSVTVGRDLGNVVAEMRPSFNFKPDQIGPSALIQDAINDQTEHLRNKVLMTIQRQMNITVFQESVRHLRQTFRPTEKLDESMDEFRRQARKYSKGSSAYELAMIHALRQMDDADKTSLALCSDEFMHYFLSNYQAELQAFLNISDVIEAHVSRIDSEELAGAYEDILVKSQSFLQALGAIVRRIGVEHIATWVPFLTKSAVADLVSPEVGSDKVHLMLVLQELKSFRVLNTFMAMLKEVEEKHLQGRPVHNYVLTSFEYTEQPLVTMSLIERWVNACSTQEQILFFQDYRRVFSKLSEEAYKDDEQRRNALSVIQRKIDDMVYSEEE